MHVDRSTASIRFTMLRCLLVFALIAMCHCHTRHIVFLEGTQGSGKTYFARHLPKNLNVDGLVHRLVDIEEPYEDWSNSGIIDTFKSNLQEFNPLFQCAIMASLTTVLREAVQKARHTDILIVNRSIHGAFHVYFDIFKTDGYRGNEIVRYIYNQLDLGLPSLYIFLDTPPELAHERIISRNRADEARTMTFDYVKLQHDKYTNLFKNVLTKHEEITTYYYHVDDANAIEAIKDHVRRPMR
jgi:deoxyadenosine/deoxycytidine kinase